MLRVAQRRLANEKRKSFPKKPRAPEYWPHDLSYALEFFWDWQRAEYSPLLTPDGLSWGEQDREFWRLIYYLQDLWAWADHRAKNPVLQIRSGDMTMDKL